MANTGVTGRVVNTAGQGVPNLCIGAFDAEVSDAPVLMGQAMTNASGEYTIAYSKWAYGAERRPDIIIRVYDEVGRLVYETPEYPDVSDATFAVPLITIRDADLSGFLVTLLTGSPTLLSSNNLIKPLIDNKIAWDEMTSAVKSAANFVHLAQLYFDVGQVITQFIPSTPPDHAATTGDRLEEELYKANHDRAVKALILMNDFKGMPYPTDTSGHMEDFIAEKQPHTMEFKRFRMPYNRAMHAKMMLVDGQYAYMNASPFLQEYFDDVTHAIDEKRRGAMSWPKNSIQVPVHDVSLALQGPAIAHLDETFDALWRKTGGTSAGVATPATPTPGAGWVSGSVQITRTLPGATFTTAGGAALPGELGILESYLRAFRQAEDFIYLENQYVTELVLVRGLLYALRLKPNLQVILLTNNAVDIPRYQSLQTKLIRQFLSEAATMNVRDRIGVFTRWTHDPAATPKQRIIRNYVHSKVGLVDDRWATVGSANLDGVSLHVSQHVLFYYSNSDLDEERAVEVNAAFFNNVAGQPACTVPADLRLALWAEHLGLSGPNDPALASRPAGGWLKLWQDAADAKLTGLKAAPATGHPASILTWAGEADPEDYLEELGIIDPGTKFTVETSVKDFDFKTGEWS